MLINSSAINTAAINDAATVTTEIGTGSGLMISVEQQVAKIGSGEMISVEQTVQLRLSTSAPAKMISVEQIVQATHASSNIARVEQRVVDSSIPSRVDRCGWDCTLVVGGYQIPNSQIVGTIEVDRTENDAALMNITLRPGAGVQYVENYHGKTVTLDVHEPAGTTRLYTGVVDIPDIDMYEEKITLRCTDRRREQLNQQLPGIVNTIGVYSPHLFKIPEDTAEEVDQRLTTTPYAIDFDSYGNYTLTPWAPKSTADFTITGSNIFRYSPKVELTSRGRVVNKVDIKMQYRYERFYHHERTYRWESPINTDICKLLQYGYSLTSKAMVQQAAESAGWPIKNSINFTNIHEAGWYRCSGVQVGWATTELIGEVTEAKDEQGNTRTDSNGKTLYESRITGGTDYSQVYCMKADWVATTRWSQVVTEEYNLSLSAPQSIAQYGTITEQKTYAIDEEADSAAWENYTGYKSRVGYSSNYVIDQDFKRGEFAQAVAVALAQGKNSILGSHRDTRVMFDHTHLWSAVDLKHTVEVDDDELACKGKVFSLSHRLNVSTGQARTSVTLVLSRAQGSATNSSLTVPSKISDTPTFNTNVIVLGNHYGEDPTTQAAASWTGMVGNKFVTEYTNTRASTFRTTYQEQFIVDTPGIDNMLREERQLSASSSYTVAIPNDNLTITFDGKS